MMGGIFKEILIEGFREFNLRKLKEFGLKKYLIVVGSTIGTGLIGGSLGYFTISRNLTSNEMGDEQFARITKRDIPQSIEQHEENEKLEDKER